MNFDAKFSHGEKFADEKFSLVEKNSRACIGAFRKINTTFFSGKWFFPMNNNKRLRVWLCYHWKRKKKKLKNCQISQPKSKVFQKSIKEKSFLFVVCVVFKEKSSANLLSAFLIKCFLREKIKFSLSSVKIVVLRRERKKKQFPGKISPINYRNNGKGEKISQGSKRRSLRPQTSATSSSARTSWRPAKAEKSSEKGRVRLIIKTCESENSIWWITFFIDDFPVPVDIQREVMEDSRDRGRLLMWIP